MNNDYTVVDINSYPTNHCPNNEPSTFDSPIEQKEETGVFNSTIQGILNDLRVPEDLMQSFSILQDDYLHPKKTIPVSKGDYELIQKSFSNETFIKIKKEIDNFPLNGPSINSLSSISDLINSFFRDPQKKTICMSKLSLYEKSIMKWRKVRGDGNCFFRGIIYYYLENIILTRNDQMIRNIIYDIYVNYNEPYFKSKISKYQINFERILHLLILINFGLNIKDPNEAINLSLSILMKAFNNSKDFDHGLIFHLRYEIYKYIKSNEGKLYSKDFSVNIGNLLQSTYETQDGKFLYQVFFDKNLLEMGKEAEKIIIYITPYVLNINLTLYSLNFGKNTNELNAIYFKCLNAKLTNEQLITLMYSGNHFDVIYETNYFNLYRKYLAGDFKPIIKRIPEPLKIDEMSTKTTNQGRIGNTMPNLPYNSAKTVQSCPFPIVQNYNSNCSIPQRQITQPAIMNPPISTINTNMIPNNTYNGPTSIIITQCLKANECPVCKSKINHNNVCDTCHSNQLKSWLKQQYIIFINTNQSNMISQKGIKTFKQYLNETLINYDTGVKISFDKVYNALPSGTQFNIVNVTSSIKSSYCLYCHQIISESDESIVFEMPCECVFCKAECLKNYFKAMPLECRVNYFCVCGIEYDITQLKYLVNFFKSHGLRKFKNDVIRFVYSKMKNKCANCKVLLYPNIQNNSVFVLEVKDDEIEKIFNIQSFHHLICDTCGPALSDYYNQKKETVFKCSLCNSNHHLIKHFTTKAEIINESSCIIF